jgi:3-oxoadipate enol-lactonase
MPNFVRGEQHAIYFEEIGSGSPLILLCGISADLSVWKFLAAELSPHFRVIMLDNRGVGRTQTPDAPFTVADMAEDVRALMDHLGVESAHVLGWSMGGIIAQTLALTHPQRVKKLVLVGSFAEADGLLREAIGTWANMQRSNLPYEQIARHVAWLNYSPALANKPVYEKFIQSIIDNPYRQSVTGFVRQAEALVSFRASPELGRLSVPTAVLVGRDDKLAPPHLSEHLVQTIPGATLQVLPGAHAGFIEYPQQYAQAVRDAVGLGAMQKG